MSVTSSASAYDIKDDIRLSVQKDAAAKELFGNMQPLDCFDDHIIRNIIERINVNSKTEITVRFRGGLEISGPVEK